MSEKLERYQLYREAREHRNSYFEKLTLLDGGTVALVISAVLGPLHGQVRHKYLLGVGLSFLVGAMLLLLRRNYLAAHFEFHTAAMAANDPTYVDHTRANWLAKDINYTEIACLILSATGIVLLLVEVWLILIS